MVAGFVDGDLEAEFKEFSSVVEAGDPLRLSDARADWQEEGRAIICIRHMWRRRPAGRSLPVRLRAKLIVSVSVSS